MKINNSHQLIVEYKYISIHKLIIRPIQLQVPILLQKQNVYAFQVELAARVINEASAPKDTLARHTRAYLTSNTNAESIYVVDIIIYIRFVIQLAPLQDLTTCYW